MNYEKIDIQPQPTFVIGDIHGDIEMLKTQITNDEKVRNCNLIIAGDIGLGFQSMAFHLREYNSFNKWLTEKGISLYLIRGNHDDPSYFDEGIIDSSNVKTLKDYTILTINNTNILCVGGALSIDRTYRKRKYSERLLYMQKVYEGQMSDVEILSLVNKGYWENELPIYDEEALTEIKNNNIQLNYIITHTSPSWAFKNNNEGLKWWLSVDKSLKDDLVVEREAITNIYNKVIADEHPIREWIYGHFHEHHEDNFNGVHFTALANADWSWDIKEINID